MLLLLYECDRCYCYLIITINHHIIIQATVTDVTTHFKSQTTVVVFYSILMYTIYNNKLQYLSIRDDICVCNNMLRGLSMIDATLNRCRQCDYMTTLGE